LTIIEFSATSLERSGFRGAAVAPGDERWDAARQAFNVLVDQRPALIAFPADEHDVAAAVRFARENGLRVAPQRTGHNAGPLGALDDTILLKTDALQGVAIDAARKVARVGAATRWADVVPQASELGLAALHGSTPDVSVVGYSLGGGLGWYGRKLGLAANSVVAVELVTADGRLRRVDQEHEPELFWALRGGGGSFGVVTSIEFRLYPLAHVYAGAFFFPWERSAEVLHAWREWTETAPDEITSVGRILRFPPLPDVPEPLRGRSFALVEAVYLGDEADGAALLRPLRELGPALATFASVPPAGISTLHMDPRHPVPHCADHRLLGPLPAEAIDALVAVAGPESGSPLVSVEVRHTGGALARVAPHHGALAALPGSFALFAVGAPNDAAPEAAVEARLELVTEALAPYDVGRYLNFALRQTAAERFFPDGAHRRLQAVKAQYDPEDRFRANHPITRAR
jgi:UDP-N-acetylenolpyruvoylglucosamine reductase